MATIIATTTSSNIEDSSEQTPADDFFIQAVCESPNAFIVVKAKIEGGASYVVIGSFKAKETPIKKFRRMPFVTVGVEQNEQGKSVTVYMV